MISIARSTCPAVLAGGSRARDRYKIQQVVEKLHRMQHGKCCYCEDRVPEAGHSKTVEHFHPKAVFEGKRNDWDNLLLACPQCNGAKSNDFPVESLTDGAGDAAKVLYVERKGEGDVLDPSHASVDPENELEFVVNHMDELMGLMVPRRDSHRGRATIEVIKLDSAFHTRRHKTYLLQLYSKYNVLLTACDLEVQNYIDDAKASLAMCLSARSRFAAVAREFARALNLEGRFGIRVPLGAEE